MQGPGEREEWGVTLRKYRVSFWGDENILELVVTLEQLCNYTKNNELYTLKGEIYGTGTVSQ